MENEVNGRWIHQEGSSDKYNVVDLSEPKDNPFLPEDYIEEFKPSFALTQMQFAYFQKRIDEDINQSFLNEGYFIAKFFHRANEK